MEVDKYNLKMRTNDDFMLTVNVGYSIAEATPKLIVVSNPKLVDWSSFISVVNATTGEFIIHVKASGIEELGAGQYLYECIMDFGGGSKAFLFGGSLKVSKGLV